MNPKLIAVPLLMVLGGCTSQQDRDRGITASDRRALDAQAVQNAQCVFEDQFACRHIIENRVLFARFFTPKGLGGLNENEKTRGRSITTSYVVDAAAAIKQCKRAEGQAIELIKDVQISGRSWQVMGTAPLDANSSCYITPEVLEAS